MKIKLITYSILLCLGILFLIPQTAMASNGSTDTGLVGCAGLDCQFCEFLELVQNVINFMIQMSFIVAAALIVVGGLFMLMSGAADGISKGRKIITSGVAGLGLILGAWLIVNLVLFVILPQEAKDSGSSLLSWYKIDCQDIEDNVLFLPKDISLRDFTQYDYTRRVPGETGPGITEPGNYEVDPDGPRGSNPAGSSDMTEAEARAIFEQYGIWVKKDCPTGQGVGCVDLEGLQRHIPGRIDDLQDRIGGGYIPKVTGGTELGVHSNRNPKNHENGWKIDFDKDSTIDGYITGNFDELPDKRSDGATGYQDPVTKDIYWDEGDHWDVVYTDPLPGE